MTRQQALKKAQALWGKRAAVQMTPRGGFIGLHGEYVAHRYTGKPENPKHGRYRCDSCSGAAVEDGDYIERSVWHSVGALQTSYKIGTIDLGMFFSVRAESDSFEACFEMIARKASAA